MYGIKITYSWGDEEHGLHGVFNTKEDAFAKACELAGKEAYVQNEEFEDGRTCTIYVDGANLRIDLRYDVDGEYCCYRIEEKTDYKLTEHGKQLIESYIKELEAKRKEILDAGLDTIEETPNLPTVEEIFEDLIGEGFDELGEVYNGWFVTDNYNADYPIVLRLGIDVVKI